MTKKIVWILLFGIIILAGILRFWELGQVPVSPDWDEAALGYNAYSIMHTGRDEYGKFLPVVLKSFGDYKPALYSYLAIPSIAVFDLTVFAVRLPSAIFGVLTVLLVFLLVKELFGKNNLALISSFLLAISPWHIQFSRVAFETNIGLTLNILGAFLFIKALKKPWLLIFSAIIFALNFYAYQSEKVFMPLLVAALVIIFHKQIFRLPKKIISLAIIAGIIVALPMVSFIMTDKSALSRAAGVSVFAQQSEDIAKNAKLLLYDKNTHNVLGQVLDNRRIFFAKEIIGNYLSHWSLNWLFITGDIERHHAPGMGLLYLWEFPFLFIGISSLLFGKYDKKTKWIIFSWFMLAPIPASITTGVPHAVRTFNFLPTFQIFVALGLLDAFLFIYSKKNKIFFVIAALVVFFFSLFSIVYYLNQYFVQTNYFYSQYWQYGYKEAVLFAKFHENDYQHIIVSNTGNMDQSYIFFLFYLKYPPELYQQEEKNLPANNNHKFGKYEFRPINWSEDSKLGNTLFVSGSDENLSARKILTIRNINGSPTMTIFAK